MNAECEYTEEQEFKTLGDFFHDYIKVKGMNMNINFQISNNPNYGNNGKANAAIEQKFNDYVFLLH